MALWFGWKLVWNVLLEKVKSHPVHPEFQCVFMVLTFHHTCQQVWFMVRYPMTWLWLTHITNSIQFWELESGKVEFLKVYWIKMKKNKKTNVPKSFYILHLGHQWPKVEIIVQDFDNLRMSNHPYFSSLDKVCQGQQRPHLFLPVKKSLTYSMGLRLQSSWTSRLKWKPRWRHSVPQNYEICSSTYVNPHLLLCHILCACWRNPAEPRLSARGHCYTVPCWKSRLHPW